MRKIVLTYGLISGAIAAALMVLMTVYIRQTNNFKTSEVIGYASILLGMLLVFFGVRAYRDQVGGGTITFGRALQVGLLITFIASLCYVLTWLVTYYNFMPDFMDRFAQYQLHQVRASGASEEKIQETASQMEYYKGLYRNPLSVAAFTFIEPFPVGLLVTLISALILRRKSFV
jgi:hypothetical protein